MMERNSSNSLGIFIIAHNDQMITEIKIRFSQVQAFVNIIGQTSSSRFSLADIDLKTVDCLAMDERFFVEMSKKESVFIPTIIFKYHNTTTIQSFTGAAIGTIGPLMNDTLEATLNQAVIFKRYFEVKKNVALSKNYLASNKLASSFLLKKGKDFQLVDAEKIVMFYTVNKLTFAYNDKGMRFIFHSTLIELENQLDKNLFFRINRQFLVNRKYIDKLRQMDDRKFKLVSLVNNIPEIIINAQSFSKFRAWVENH